MSLSDQIKQPGQIIGGGDGVGGGATTDLADWPAGLSEVELGYVNGVTSAIQTQLDGKAASSHTHAASDLTTGQVALARGGTNADLSATGGTGHVLKQSSAGANITVGALTASDIPSTLNATTFAGNITMSSGGALARSADTSIVVLCGGTTDNQANGSFVRAYGNSHATKPGIAEYYTGSASGAKHQFFDKNGTEQLRVDENGLRCNNPITLSGSISSAGAGVRNVHGNGNANDYVINVPSGKFSATINGSEYFKVDTYGANIWGCSFGVHGHHGIRQFLSGSYHTTVYGGSGEGDGGHFRAIGSTAPSPSATEIQSGLLSRTASTEFKLCYYATGDMALVTVLETTIASFRVKVDSAATVTFTNLDGGAASASIVNSSSPAAGEIGVYISGGQLLCKPGSSYAGQMAVFAQIGKV